MTEATLKPEEHVVLVSRTTDPGTEYQWAVVRLTPTRARKLMELEGLHKEVYDRCYGSHGMLYALEFADLSVNYGESIALTYDDEDGLEGWYQVDRNPGLSGTGPGEPSPTSWALLVVNEDGILWSAGPRHVDGYFETPRIDWDTIVLLSEGKVCFPHLPQPVLVCRECGLGMIIDDVGVSHHIDDDGAIDHATDGDHVAIRDDDDEDM